LADRIAEARRDLASQTLDGGVSRRGGGNTKRCHVSAGDAFRPTSSSFVYHACVTPEDAKPLIYWTLWLLKRYEPPGGGRSRGKPVSANPAP